VTNFDEASLAEQRAEVIARAAELGILVLDLERPIPGPVRVQFDGHPADVADTLTLLEQRGIRLDDLAPPAESAWGVQRTGALDLGRADNARRRRGPAGDGEVRIRLRGAADDVGKVVAVLRTVLPFTQVRPINDDGGRMRTYIAVDATGIERGEGG
jgi:hypothetical protein